MPSLLKPLSLSGVCLIVFSLLEGFLSSESSTARQSIESAIDSGYFSLKQASAEGRELDSAKRKALVTKLYSREPRERWQAASELATWRDQHSVNALIAAMQDKEGTARVCVMAEALGEIGDKRAVPALVEAIDDPVNEDLRICATKALGKIGDGQALEPLIRKLNNSPNNIFTIEAMGELGDKRALPMLSELHGETTMPLVKTTIQRAILMIEIENGDDPVPALINALGSEDPATVRRALRKLALGRDARAIEAIAHLLASGDTLELKANAAAALVYYGKEARPLLESIGPAGNKVTRRAVEHALKLM